MDKIGIIVLNWQTPELTIKTVNSLLKISPHKHFSYHIFIIDNGSQDNSIQQFQKFFSSSKKITIAPTGKNLGYVEGNNFGINLSLKQKFTHTLIINSDVIVKKDFLSHLYSALSTKKYALVGPKIYFAPGYEYHHDRYTVSERGKVIWSYGSKIDWQNIYGTNFGIDQVDQGQFSHINENIDYLSGCCLLVSNKLLKKIGLFDTRYFMYLEDAEFSQRILQQGYKIACIPDSIIWHLNSGSSGRGGIHDYFLTRNRLIFGYQYTTSTRTRFALFRDSIRILLFSNYPWQRRGVLDYYLHKFAKGSWQ